MLFTNCKSFTVVKKKEREGKFPYASLVVIFSSSNNRILIATPSPRRIFGPFKKYRRYLFAVFPGFTLPAVTLPMIYDS